jgi:hypothetical protein
MTKLGQMLTTGSPSFATPADLLHVIGPLLAVLEAARREYEAHAAHGRRHFGGRACECLYCEAFQVLLPPCDADPLLAPVAPTGEGK